METGDHFQNSKWAKTLRVDILSLGSGNVTSVRNWLIRSGFQARIVMFPEQLTSELLVIPGVGSAVPYMQKIRQSCFDQAISDHVKSGRRLLGICLGFQVLTEYSDEDGGVSCLSLLKGRVERLPGGQSHNGWEPLHLERRELLDHGVIPQANLSAKRVVRGRVYYNHQFGVTALPKNTLKTPISNRLPDYIGFAATDTILGCQFHPEKSQITGIDLIKMIG